MYLVRSPIQLARWRRQEAALLLQRASLATGALRKWASRLFDAGFISIDDLQRPPAECFATALARGRLEATCHLSATCTARGTLKNRVN